MSGTYVETAVFVPIWLDYLDVATFVGNCVRVSDDQVGDENIKSFDLRVSSSRIWIGIYFQMFVKQ